MRITDIRCWIVEGEHPRWPFRWRKGLAGSGDGTPKDKKPLDAIIRVDTDEGIYGAMRVPQGPSVMSLVERRLKRLVGEDPLLTERLWWLVWEIGPDTLAAQLGALSWRLPVLFLPYMLVAGDREAAEGSVAVRHRVSGDLGSRAVADFIDEATAEVAARGSGVPSAAPAG